MLPVAYVGMKPSDHDLVLDLVLYDPASLRSYVRAFLGVRTCFSGVHCDLAVLEARELELCGRYNRFSPSPARSGDW